MSPQVNHTSKMNQTQLIIIIDFNETEKLVVSESK